MSANSTGPNEPKIKLSPYGNWVSRAIMILYIVWVLTGLWILFFFSPIFGGLVLAGGLLAWRSGDTTLPADPPTAGVLTFWGKILEMGGDPIIVGGRTVVAKFFPLMVDMVQFESTTQDKDFPVIVVSEDGLVMEGVVSLGLRPDLRKPGLYLESGKMPNIFKLLDEIVEQQAKIGAMPHKCKDIATNPMLVTEHLKKSLEMPVVKTSAGGLEQKDFGVVVWKVQSSFEMPKDYAKQLAQIPIEAAQRTAEAEDYDTMLLEAYKLLEKYRAEPAMQDNLPTLEECLQEIKALRLIKQGRSQNIGGGGRPVVVANAGGQGGN